MSLLPLTVRGARWKLISLFQGTASNGVEGWRRRILKRKTRGFVPIVCGQCQVAFRPHPGHPCLRLETRAFSLYSHYLCVEFHRFNDFTEIGALIALWILGDEDYVWLYTAKAAASCFQIIGWEHYIFRSSARPLTKLSWLQMREKKSTQRLSSPVVNKSAILRS